MIVRNLAGMESSVSDGNKASNDDCDDDDGDDDDDGEDDDDDDCDDDDSVQWSKLCCVKPALKRVSISASISSMCCKDLPVGPFEKKILSISTALKACSQLTFCSNSNVSESSPWSCSFGSTNIPKSLCANSIMSSFFRSPTVGQPSSLLTNEMISASVIPLVSGIWISICAIGSSVSSAWSSCSGGRIIKKWNV